MVTVIQANTFGQAVDNAVALCQHEPVLNLIVEVCRGLPARAEPYIQSYLDDAALWQSTTRPAQLHFSHGEYMNRHGDSIAYIIDQLRTKPTGNRACISLVDGSRILSSGDSELPSFMSLQAGFSRGDTRMLHLTAYYRALEVSSFLPINLAEMAIIADAIAVKIPTISSLDLTLHAFRAHSLQDFRTHTRSAIDVASAIEIGEAVVSHNSAVIQSWLIEKSQPETLIELTGLAQLLTDANLAAYSAPWTANLQQAVATLTELKMARENGTHASTIDTLQRQLTTLLAELANGLD